MNGGIDRVKFKFEIQDLFKLPNILCYIRILMVPLFLYVYFTAETQHDYYFATMIVLASGITDFLDGQIARRCNMVTDLGRVIDPIADKLMQLSMLAALMLNVRYMYLLVVYLVLKEVISTVFAFICWKTLHRRLNGAKWYGKVCTALLYAVMLVMVAFPQLPQVYQKILLLVCAAALTLSFVMYLRIYIIMITDSKNGKNDKVLY